MATMVHMSFENFQDEFTKAKESLKDVDENIKKLTGRDPKMQRRRRGNENIIASSQKDRLPINSGKREWKGEENEQGPGVKRRLSALSRLNSREDVRRKRRNSDEEEDVFDKPSVQSSVVSNPNKLQLKTRTDSLNELKNDKKVLARNRRMFGFLFGTLQKFQNEQCQQKEKEQKRQEIEEKLEQAAVKEKEEVQKERRDLFFARRKQQALLRRLEQKMEIARQHEEWEKHQKCLLGFIKTKTSPQLMYLPSIMTSTSEKRLQESSAEILEEIARRRVKMEEDIKELDDEEMRDLAKHTDNGKIEEEEMPAAENNNIGSVVDGIEGNDTFVSGVVEGIEGNDTFVDSGVEVVESNDAIVKLNQPTSANEDPNHVTNETAADGNDIRPPTVSDGVPPKNEDIPMADQEFEPVYD